MTENLAAFLQFKPQYIWDSLVKNHYDVAEEIEESVQEHLTSQYKIKREVKKIVFKILERNGIDIQKFTAIQKETRLHLQKEAKKRTFGEIDEDIISCDLCFKKDQEILRLKSLIETKDATILQLEEKIRNISI